MKVYTCPICEKTFIPYPGWMYKVRIDGVHIKTLCGYNCYQKANKLKEDNKNETSSCK